MTQHRYGRRIIPERQRYRRWIDPRVWTLRVAAVVAYLREKGWKEVDPDRAHFRIFEEPYPAEGTIRAYQFVPTFEQEPGYGQQMFELLTGLAEFEDRQAAVVIDDILRLAKAGPQGNGFAADKPAPAETTR